MIPLTIMHTTNHATDFGQFGGAASAPLFKSQLGVGLTASRTAAVAPARRKWAALLTASLMSVGIFQQSVSAATVWNGPLMTFTEPVGGSGSVPSNQDRLTADVWLTRDTTKGLYNASLEGAFVPFVSPAGTEWAYGSLADHSTLTYTDWEDFNGKNPPSMVGQNAVVHLISDDIYLSVTFLSWGGSAGGFSYQRSTPTVPEPSAGALAGLGLLLGVVLRFPRRGLACLKPRR